MPATMRYIVHASVWTSSRATSTSTSSDHARVFGLGAVEIPLMEPDLVDPEAPGERAVRAGIELYSSVAMPAAADATSDDERVRKQAVAFLKRRLDPATIAPEYQDRRVEVADHRDGLRPARRRYLRQARPHARQPAPRADT